MGAPTSVLMKELGYDVNTYDTRFNKPEEYSSIVSNRDLIFIAVPTPHDSAYGGDAPTSHLPPKNFDYSILSEAVRQAAVNTTCPIVIISTVLPGTIRSLFWDLTDRIVYNPYLIGMGTVTEDLKQPDIIIIGTTDGKTTSTTNMLVDIYGKMTNYFERIHIGTFEEAESIKIFYNTFISTKLALVNMIQDVSQRIGNCNVDVVTNALKDSTFRITGPRYMTAGMGDGGPCHPRDNIALRWLAKQYGLGYDLFGSIMESREIQAKNLAKDLCHLHYSNNRMPVYIHGETFKPNVPLCDGSYSHLVGHYVKEIIKQDPIYIDPNTNPLTSVKGIILLAHNDNKYYCEFLPGSVIVDPWRTYQSTDESIKVIHYGNSRPSTSK